MMMKVFGIDKERSKVKLPNHWTDGKYYNDKYCSYW